MVLSAMRLTFDKSSDRPRFGSCAKSGALESGYAVSEPGHVEVDEQARADVQQLHITEELGLVNGQNAVTDFTSTRTRCSTNTSNRRGFFALKSLVANADDPLGLR